MGTTYGDFLSDRARQELWLVEPAPYNPDTGTTTTLYWSSDEFATGAADTPAHQIYSARVEGGPLFSFSTVPPGTLGFVGGFGGGEIRVINRFGDLDYLADYAWDGRTCVVRHGGYSPTLGRSLTYSEMGSQTYEMESVEVDDAELVIALRPRSRTFTAPLAVPRYRGMPWAVNFDGSTNYVSFGSAGVPSAVNLRNDLTVEGWFYVQVGSKIQGLASWNNGGATTYPFSFQLNASNQLRFLDSASTISVTSTAAVSTLRWLHLSVSVSGTTLRFIIYDAQARTETVETFTVSTTTRPTANGNFYHGRVTSNFFDGYIQEVRIWSAGRSAAQVRNLRHRSLTATEITAETTLKQYTKYAEGTGTTIGDSATGGTNGTLNGTATWHRSLEGDSDLEGEVKPWAGGKVWHAPAKLIHVADRTYQIHLATTHTDAPTVYEGGSAITAGTTYTDFKTFAAATTTAAQVDVLRTANGTYVRLGSNPSKPVTVVFKGDASGSGYVSDAASLVKRIVTTLPPYPLVDPDDIDSGSFTALTADNGAEVGVWIDSEQPILQPVNELLASVGALGWFTAGGLFKVKRFEGVSGSSVTTFDERSIVSVDAAVSSLPAWTVKLGFQRVYHVLDVSQFTGSVVGTNAQKLLEVPYRYAIRRNEATLTAHRRAEVRVEESLLTTRADAEAEAERRLGILDADPDEPRGWRVEVWNSGIEVDFLDVVTLSYRDLDGDGIEQERFGWADGKDALVMSIQGNGPTVMMEIWY